MRNQLANRLNKFVQEIEYISRPDNPGKIYYLRDIFSSHNVEELCFILIYLIEDNENDDSLLRLKDDFNSHLDAIIDSSNLEELPIAIEGLAQKFESFLKKIGYLSYKGTEYWHGNETSEGLTGTTLKLLCEGKVSNKYGKDYAEPLVLDLPLINYKGISRSLIDFMRTKLRNAVHYAPTINRKLLIPYSEIVLVNYLLVIQDNINILGPRYISRLALNQKIINSHSQIEDLYVENKFLEHSTDDLIRFEPRLTESHFSSSDSNPKKREGTITEIFNSVDRFIIKGIGGLGKTTTLRFFSNHLVKEEKLTPLFYSLKEYRSGTNLIEQILIDTEISSTEFEADLRKGSKYVFLLDGVNEIIDLNKRSDLLVDIKFLLKKYKDCSAILSTRKILEIQQLTLPIFNIQPFDQSGIVEFIEKNFPELSGSLIPNLNNSNRLLRLCSNPLLLQILCTIYHNEDLSKINNEALIIKTFVNKSLERERLKNPHIDSVKMFQYLMDLGYYTRSNASVSFSQNDTFKILSNCANRISPGDDIIKLISLFKDANFINESINGFSFQHELYQEYFAAEGLLFYDKNIQKLESIDHWRNPILMYSGLTSNRLELIDSIANNDTLLAAECAITSIIEESEIENKIVEKSVQSMGNRNDISQYNRGVLALLKLKKYPELKDVLPNSGKDLGDLVRPREELDGLSVIQTIIRELDNNHLLEFIELLINKDISYRNDIMRGLLDRDTEELRPIIGEVELILSINISELNSKNLLNFISLFGKENLDEKLFIEIKEQVLEDILNVNSVKSSTLTIAKELDLFGDINTICSIIESIPSDKLGVASSLPIILDNFFSDEIEKLKLLKSASLSKNLLVYLSGCIYVAWNGYKSAEKYFKYYEVFSNGYLYKIIHQKNRNYNKLVAELEKKIFKKYGAKLIGKSFNFEMKSEKPKEISLNTISTDILFNAKWKGKNAIDYIQNGLFKKGKSIHLKVKNIDYKNCYLIVNKSDINQNSLKREKRLSDDKNKKTKETDLGIKLKEALQNNQLISENGPIRLSKVARELNVSLTTAVDFLATKGIKIECNPSTKIETEAYQLLVEEYARLNN